MSIIASFDAFVYILILVLFLEVITIVMQYFLVDFEGIQKMKKEIKALQEKLKQEKDASKKAELTKQVLMSTFSMMKYQKQYLIASFFLFPIFFFLLQNPAVINVFCRIFSFLNLNSILSAVCTGCEGFVGGAVISFFGIGLNWFWTYFLLFMVASIIGSKLFLKY